MVWSYMVPKTPYWHCKKCGFFTSQGFAARVLANAYAWPHCPECRADLKFYARLLGGMVW